MPAWRPATWRGGEGYCVRPASRRSSSRAVAASREHDVNGLLGLLQRGCPAATALRITARANKP